MSMWGNALMGGIGAGLQQLGGDIYARRKMQEEAAAKAQATAELRKYEEMAAQKKLDAEMVAKGDKYDTIERTNEYGKAFKETIRQRYNPDTHRMESQSVGTAFKEEEAPKTREVERGGSKVTEEWRNGSWNEVGTAPRYKPGASEDAAAARESARDEREAKKEAAINDRWQRQQDALDNRQKESSFQADMRDFNKKSSFDKESEYAARGIDPKAKDAYQQYRKSLRSDYFPAPSFDNVSGASSSSTPLMDAGAKPGSSPETAVPANQFKSQPPSGTWVVMPNGKVMQVP